MRSTTARQGRTGGVPSPSSWRALAAAGPAADHARARALVMTLSTLAVAWTLGAAAVMLLERPDTPRAGGGRPDAAAMPEQSAAAAGRGAAPRAGAMLRADLFDAPKPRKAVAKAAPKTNPVELLALIELQGVLGGDVPRAMVRYKRTGESVVVSVGDDLGEFKVAEIRKRSVVLSWRNELFELSL